MSGFALPSSASGWEGCKSSSSSGLVSGPSLSNVPAVAPQYEQQDSTGERKHHILVPHQEAIQPPQTQPSSPDVVGDDSDCRFRVAAVDTAMPSSERASTSATALDISRLLAASPSAAVSDAICSSNRIAECCRNRGVRGDWQCVGGVAEHISSPTIPFTGDATSTLVGVIVQLVRDCGADNETSGDDGGQHRRRWRAFRRHLLSGRPL